MKRLERILALLLGVALVGCNHVPRHSGNVLRLANQAEPATLDPQLLSGMPEFRVVSCFFQGLFRLSGDSAIGAIAQTWSVSPDGLLWTFHLRPWLWSDSSRLVANDFVWSWRRALSPATASPYADLLDPVVGAKEHRKGDSSSALGIEGPNDSTLLVRLTKPTPWLPLLLCQPITYPVPRQAILRHDRKWTSPENIVTSGPWRLTEWRPDRWIQAVKNPRFPGPGPEIDTLRIYPVEDSRTALNMYRAGQVDWVFQLPSSRLEFAKSLPGFRSWPQYGTYFFRVNTTRKPFDDPRVRQALALAIPRAEIAASLARGGEEPASTFVPPTLGYTSPPGLETNFNLARKLLSQAGYPNGRGFRTFEILYNTQDLHRRIAEVVARIWQDSLGLTTTLVNHEWKSYLAAQDQLDYDVCRGAWVGDYLDPDTFLELWKTGSGNNRAGFADKMYDSLLDAANRLQGDARLKSLQVAEARLIALSPFLPVYHYRNLELHRPGLIGISQNSLGVHAFQNVAWSKP